MGIQHSALEHALIQPSAATGETAGKNVGSSILYCKADSLETPKRAGGLLALDNTMKRVLV